MCPRNSLAPNISPRFLRKNWPKFCDSTISILLPAKTIPCSNALIEAMACGLPALYLNDGGHPELVGYGGLPFESESEILPQLDKLADNYHMYQSLIAVSNMDEVADKYLTLIREVVR